MIIIYYTMQHGYTPLMAASSNDNVEICDLLISKGADVNKADNVWDILYNIICYSAVN
jgi:ankyrin repeat protein